MKAKSPSRYSGQRSPHFRYAARIKLAALTGVDAVRSRAAAKIRAVVQTRVGGDHQAGLRKRLGFVLGRRAQQTVSQGDRAIVPPCPVIRTARCHSGDHGRDDRRIRGSAVAIDSGKSAHELFRGLGSSGYRARASHACGRSPHDGTRQARAASQSFRLVRGQSGLLRRPAVSARAQRGRTRARRSKAADLPTC